MRRDDLEAILSRLAPGPLGDAPRRCGRVPDEIHRLIVGAAQPAELAAGHVALTLSPGDGPGYALGDAPFAHPEGFSAALSVSISGRHGMAVGRTGRAQLRKLAVFVPATHLDAVRDALSAAGAGHIGNYRDCTFAAPGIGSFLPLEGTDPFIGRPGTREYVAEVRLETVFPAYMEAQVLEAMRATHPYEEIAYDLYDLRNDEPTYGSTRLVSIDPTGIADLSVKVQSLSSAKELEWCAPSGADPKVQRALVSINADEDCSDLAEAFGVQAVISGTLPPAEEERLLSRGVARIRAANLWLCGLRHFALRLENAGVPVPVVLLSGGFQWHKPKPPQPTRRL